MKKYICDICGYEYDPAAGDPDNGIAPGTPFEALPADWVCPMCGEARKISLLSTSRRLSVPGPFDTQLVFEPVKGAAD